MSDAASAAVMQLDLKARDLTCALSPDRTLAITGVVGKVVRLWHVESGCLLRAFEGHTERIWGLAWSGD
jgi:WD40 repeat protein